MSPNDLPSRSDAPLDAAGDVVERLIAEGLISTAAAAKLLSKGREKPLAAGSVARWATDGVHTTDGRLIRLEAFRLAGRIKTSAAAVYRWVRSQQPIVEG